MTFDAIPLVVQTHPDLRRGPKDLYGALNSAANVGEDWTQAELAKRLVCSVRSVIRWAQQLVAAGLLEIRRRGQGLANVYILLGPVVRGRSDKRPRPAVSGGQATTRRWQPATQPGRRLDRNTDPAAGYDVAAYLAREAATAQEVGARYGRYPGR